MDGWNKIDLHQHTLHEITYDGKRPSTNYTHEKFEDLIIQQEVKLKAVTNHNVLNISDHVKHALICQKNNVQYLPGVEIDYSFEGKDVHAITIINPQCDVIRFADNLNKYINNKDSKKYLNKEEFATVHENLEYIFIPHIMKTKGIYPSSSEPAVSTAEDWVMSMIKNGMFVPVLFENTKDYFKYSVYAKIEKYFNDNYEMPPCYTGSDYKFDNDEDRRKKAINRVKYYINAEPTYRGLEISIRNHETRISHEDELITRNKYLTSAKIMSSANFQESHLSFSPYLNVIIGGSGTGKTLLLNEIYRKINSEDLKSVKVGNSKKPAYYSKTNGKEILKLNSTPQDYSGLKTVEIPNVYEEIMKYVNDVSELSKVFGISNRSYVNSIINDYLGRCNEYEECISSKKDSKEKGTNALDNIFTSIEFMKLNENKSSTFNLDIKNQLEKKSTKIQDKIDDNKKLLDKKDELIDYFKKIGNALGEESKELIESIIKSYLQLLKMLNDKQLSLEQKKTFNLINERIETLLNNAIKEANKKLGQKEQAYKSKKEVMDSNVIILSQSIREYIKSEIKANSIDLTYPFDSLKHTIEEKNSTKFARFTMQMSEEDLSNIDSSDAENSLINTKNKLTKLKKIKHKEVNFLNSNSVKIFIYEINEQDIHIRDTLNTDILLKLELNTEGVWKPATSINQGTISKISMKYFFEDLIKNEQPDIIFIDQPENDVDKEFLTNTLASFLLHQKMTTQIFITSHDPILTVNADANMIIQADVDENSKINYMSYPLEYTDNKVMGTDKVATLLDGGKNNIEKRYQIYGGILKYGN